MKARSFDFTSLLRPGLPPPAIKCTGAARYNFIGGNNDNDQVPVDGLIAAAKAVLEREGRALASYGVGSGPQGYRPLREFLATKLRKDAGIRCTFDDILMVSGSLQALDLVNGALLARGDTVIVEQDNYQGVLTRLERLGVHAVGIPLDHEGMRIDALAAELAALKRHGIRPKYIYTIPTVQNPTGTIMPEHRRIELALQVFNLFGTQNLGVTNGQQIAGGNTTNATSASFGKIQGAFNLQQAELSARFAF